ncbi:MAG: gliding motility lipoprotein GldH [Prevotella sp.]|nr:gliding motility lipoprotein GldH [Prevotella sp.]
MAFAIMMLTVSCDEDTVYDSYVPVSVMGWEKNEALIFDIPHVESSGMYNISIGLRTTEAFPFTSLSLVVEQTVEPAKKMFTDTLDCVLVDDNGNILGKGVGCYQYDFTLKNIELHKNDSLHILIHHVMRRDILPGISDVGVKVSKRN